MLLFIAQVPLNMKVPVSTAHLVVKRSIALKKQKALEVLHLRSRRVQVKIELLGV